MAELDAQGREVLDETPLVLPVKALRRPSTLDEIRQYIGIVNQEAARSGQETFEEADDFDVGDDHDPHSPWEMAVDQEENWSAFREQLEEQRVQAAKGRRAGVEPPPGATPAPTPSPPAAPAPAPARVTPSEGGQ